MRISTDETNDTVARHPEEVLMEIPRQMRWPVLYATTNVDHTKNKTSHRRWTASIWLSALVLCALNATPMCQAWMSTDMFRSRRFVSSARLRERTWGYRTLLWKKPARALEAVTTNATFQQQQQQFILPNDKEPLSAIDESVVPDRASLLLEQAEDLRRRARVIMAEALLMEADLASTKAVAASRKQKDVSSLILKIFEGGRPLTPDAVAQALIVNRVSGDQAVALVEHLYQQIKSSRLMLMNQTESFAKAPDQQQQEQLGSEAEITVSTIELMEGRLDCLFRGAEIVDRRAANATQPNASLRRWGYPRRVAKSLKSKASELRRTDELEAVRKEAALRQITNHTIVVEADSPEMTVSTETNSSTGQTREGGRAVLTPIWLPSPLLEGLEEAGATIDPEDIKTIYEKVLPGTPFFCTSSESIPSATLFRGNLRELPGEAATGELTSGSPSDALSTRAFAEIQTKLEARGLSQRIQLFFLQDPSWRPPRDTRDSAGVPPSMTITRNSNTLVPDPVLLAIPASVEPNPRINPKDKELGFWSKVIRRSSVGLTIFTVFCYSLSCYALNPNFFRAIVRQNDISVVWACAPLFLALFGIQGIHELAHIVVARRKGIRTGMPVPIPSTQLGTFGCITPFRSFPLSRSDMLDFAISGPVAGTISSMICMIIGILHTTHASKADLARYPFVPMATLRSSFLTGILMTVFAPKAMVLPASQPVPVHPLVLAGFSGLVASALNMLPVARLDGGRACNAAMGTRFGSFASASTLLFLLSSTLSGGSGLTFAWSIVILVSQRRPEVPARNEVTEISDRRMMGWLASLFFGILALAPFPSTWRQQ